MYLTEKRGQETEGFKKGGSRKSRGWWGRYLKKVEFTAFRGDAGKKPLSSVRKRNAWCEEREIQGEGLSSKN